MVVNVTYSVTAGAVEAHQPATTYIDTIKPASSANLKRH